MQSDQTIIRKNHMRQLYHTTELIGIKDKHITLNKVFQRETPIEVFATLDYPLPKCKHCKGVQIKYDSQKHSKIPFIEIGGFPSLIRLKKRRSQCKSCRKVAVAETSLVQKNCQISEPLRQKVAQTLVNRGALTNIAQQSAISSSTVYRKLNQFVIKEDFSKLPEVLSWDGFSYQKGELAFIAQDFESKKSSPYWTTGDKQPFEITSLDTLKRLETVSKSLPLICQEAIFRSLKSYFLKLTSS